MTIALIGKVTFYLSRKHVAKITKSIQIEFKLKETISIPCR